MAIAKSGFSWTLCSMAALVFLLVWLYRFNILGGALGGFDNDHFVHFAYAKQVQAGEQPLRDFLDAWQGARPSLQYELSAAAQQWLGNNLRSEAWLTVTGVALGAAAAFVAGSQLGAWPWAFVATLLSALLSPKLYGYPKVLAFGVASLLIVWYARSPTGRRLAVLAAWTAIAFLFRHDYAVYCGIGFLAVIALERRASWKQSALHATAYGLATVIMLGPSIWWIQRYAGVLEYVRNALAMSRYESDLTRLQWPVPSLANTASLTDVLRLEENTAAWLYYVFLALPILAIALAVSHRRRGKPDAEGRNSALLALGLMTCVLSYFLLRASLEARFGDVAPPLAVIAAALVTEATRRGGSRVLPWMVRISATVGILLVSTACIVFLQAVPSQLYLSRLLAGPTALVEQTTRTSQELVGMPASLRVGGPVERMQASDYLHRCTSPTDRVLVVAYAPEALVFAERLFAGGRATFVYGFYRDERYSRRTFEILESESVPIALAEPESYYEPIPLLADYLRSHYVDAGTVMANGRPLRVLVRHGVSGNPFGSGGWPCFR